MPKPWAKLEQNFINHPKFLALTSNAICLWLEGKNYCDMYQTDGAIPKTALQTFRFSGAKSMCLLITSCGRKPNGTPYAPLWEPFDIGGVPYVRMHDYLDYNDCRDDVLARLTDATERTELRRLKNRAKQQRFRDARQEGLREGLRNQVRNGYVTPVTRPPTETETETETSKKERETRARPSVLTGSLPREHVNHVFCDPTFSICVVPQVHGKFLNALARRFSGDREEAHNRLKAWYVRVVAQLPADTVMGDGFRFWQPLFDAEFVVPTVIKPPPRDYEADVQADADAIRDLLRKQGAL